MSHQVAYQDAAPFMLISEGSLADVNKKLPSGVSKVTMDQFRPNFVASGCDAFDEVCIQHNTLNHNTLHHDTFTP